MKLFLAPMAGITDFPMRLLCKEQGCDVCTTEMISAQGLITAPRKSRAYRDLTRRAPFEAPLMAQIFGHDPLFMGQAAEKLSMMGRFSHIDINMGCPAHKVVGSGSGSALLKDELLVAKIIKSVVSMSHLPVSVKIRLGFDEAHINACEIAKIAQEEGAAFVTVHGRTRMQQYSGVADWEKIGEVKRSVHMPVVLNGDIVDGKSALEAIALTQCDGIAIGRGALGNPFIFKEVQSAFNHEAYQKPCLEEILKIAKRHAHYMRVWQGERTALLQMRKHLSWYTVGVRGAAQVRKQINQTEDFDKVFALLNTLLEM